MPVTTVFKDKVGAGISFPASSQLLDEHLRNDTVAAYFVSTASWLRQAAPADGARLPVLRLQRGALRLRVRNERVLPLPDGCTLRAIVYAVPSHAKKAATDALLRHAIDWATRIPERGGLVAYFEAPGGISIERTLPNWV